MKVLIVRHAESEGNATGDYSSRQSDSLSVRGERQAVALADALSGWTFDKIISSPLRRALQTIAPYLSATHLRAEIWPEIAEACWHDDREAPAEVWHAQPASLPDAVDRSLFVFRDGRAIRPAHPESFGMGLRRVHCALEHIRASVSASTGTVLMVTHGHFIRELLNLMLSPAGLVAFHHDNCGGTLMHLREGWRMAFCNRPLDVGG